MYRFALAAVLAGLLSGCGSYSSYVESEDTALGRVVVYRNGIAYFERRAHVDGNRLTLRVPRDKVDDFLKSLTVRDATTGKAFPVSFPTREAAEDGMVDMVIQLPRTGDQDLILSYITESPAWKPSYRLVVDAEGKVNVQGWAIVDNTSGEDWRQVRLGVGSSSALSFRYDLRTVRIVRREQLQAQQHFAAAPPRGGSVHGDNNGEGQVAVLGELSDQDIPRPVGHPDMVPADEDGAEDAPVMAEVATGNDRGGAVYHSRVSRRRTRGRSARRPSSRPTTPAPPRTTAEAPAVDSLASRGAARPQQQARNGDDARVAEMARTLSTNQANVVIEGYAERGERDANRRALDRANLLRNRLIREGVAPAQIRVVGRGVVAGRGPGVRVVTDATTAAAPAGQRAGGARQAGPVGDGDPVGESHFESDSTMTVTRGTSAMVAILDGKAEGEVVYLYDPDARRGSKRYAFKAVRFTNPTDSTLESGPVTVYGNNRFIGEGLSDPIPPHATAFVPFALDRQIVVDRRGTSGDRISRLVTVQRGVVTAETQHTRTTKLTITNRQTLPARVFVRHTLRKGWVLTKNPDVYERLGESHLFEVTLTPGQTRVLEVEEATPLVRTIDIRSDLGLNMVKAYLALPRADQRLQEPMRELLRIHTEMANTEQEIASQRERMSDYRERIDELNAQIVNLQAARAGGNRLMRHLRDKMIEMSNKLQASTIAVVTLQQTLLLAKIRFQDGLAELTIDEKPASDTGSAAAAAAADAD